MKTKQETFDQSVGGILAQGGPAIQARAHGMECRYRTASGRKCAAGQLIPDDMYSPLLEGLTVSPGVRPGVLIVELGYDTRFVMDLQRLHDRAAAGLTKEPYYATDAEFLVVFRERARAFAVAHGLSTAILDAPIGGAA